MGSRSKCWKTTSKPGSNFCAKICSFFITFPYLSSSQQVAQKVFWHPLANTIADAKCRKNAINWHSNIKSTRIIKVSYRRGCNYFPFWHPIPGFSALSGNRFLSNQKLQLVSMEIKVVKTSQEAVRDLKNINAITRVTESVTTLFSFLTFRYLSGNSLAVIRAFRGACQIG